MPLMCHKGETSRTSRATWLISSSRSPSNNRHFSTSSRTISALAAVYSPMLRCPRPSQRRTSTHSLKRRRSNSALLASSRKVAWCPDQDRERSDSRLEVTVAPASPRSARPCLRPPVAPSVATRRSRPSSASMRTSTTKAGCRSPALLSSARPPTGC